MLITKEDLQTYTGVRPDEEFNQQDLYIQSAENIVINYLRYDPAINDYICFINVDNQTDSIYLPAKPIQEIKSIKINGIEESIENYFFRNGSIFIKNGNLKKGNYEVSFIAGFEEIPAIIKLTILRIAGILQTESNGNIGITSKSFAESGNRTFVNTTNFDKYLILLSDYRILED